MQVKQEPAPSWKKQAKKKRELDLMDRSAA
jgi:hypothetical protein